MAKYKGKQDINKMNNRTNKQTHNKTNNRTNQNIHNRTNNRTRTSNKVAKKQKRKIRGILPYVLIGAAATFVVGGEVKERINAESIIERAKLNVPRSFKNIDQEKMGKYLKNQLKVLYSEYPDVDNWLYEGSENTKEPEFIDDIYNLYKAYLVDKKGKEVESIDGTEIRTKDQIIWTSDVLKATVTVENKETGEEEEKLEKVAETHDERDKIITNAFIEATDENGDRDGENFAKEMYELLAKEVGLKDKVATSEEINEQIEENGFYYDSLNETFYTEVGKAKLVNEKELKQLEKKAKQITDSEREQDKKEDTSTARESEDMGIR